MIHSGGAKLNSKCNLMVISQVILSLQLLMAAENTLIIDDRTTGTFEASSGNAWVLVTDDVMGGVSKGKLSVREIDGRACLHMQGGVSLENNGGFVQITLNLPGSVLVNVEKYDGIFLEIYGNDEQYNVHLRTDDITLPWQSYRASFMARSEWQNVYLSFDEFVPYRIQKALAIQSLKRIGIVAIGRVFTADLCVGKVAFYSK